MSKRFLKREARLLALPVRERLSPKGVEQFQSLILEYYRTHGREFPWRQRRTPYRVLVSEIMLQQTQADRVVPKFRAFLKVFPSFRSLSRASIADVYGLWQGLGYNRRAKMLRDCAQVVVQDFGGRLPKDEETLRQLPGIGPYTAGAVSAFAFDRPSLPIETNIRSVYIHMLCARGNIVSDRHIERLLKKTLPHSSPADWYDALMDYGAWIKAREPGIGKRSVAYVKQSPFKGSSRELRGRILRLLHERPRSLIQLSSQMPDSKERIKRGVNALTGEGLIQESRGILAVN